MQFAETHDAWLGRRVCSVARRPEHYTCTCRVSAFGKDVENGDFIVASNGDVGCVEACVNDGASFFGGATNGCGRRAAWRHSARYHMNENYVKRARLSWSCSENGKVPISLFLSLSLSLSIFISRSAFLEQI